MNKDQKENLKRQLEASVRLDGRAYDEYRDVQVTKGVVETAEGSAEVQIGDTHVIAGVKMEAGTPYSDSPDEGVLMVGVELSPIANVDFETGPPSFNAIELARVTDRGIRESKSIDVHKLCIKEGEKVWIVNVDIAIINDDGNLFDACSLAAIAAIQDAKIPEFSEKSGVDYSKKTKKGLPLTKQPIGITVVKIGNTLLADPTNLELKGLDARLTITTVDDGTICALQKGGEGTLTADVVMAMVDIAQKKAAELRKKL